MCYGTSGGCYGVLIKPYVAKRSNSSKEERAFAGHTGCPRTRSARRARFSFIYDIKRLARCFKADIM